MPNLYLTHKCNRGCPFCFARKVLKESGGDVNEMLSVEEVERLLDRFRGQLPELGLLGGEPFLYPRLGKLLEALDREGVYAKIFTSATDPLPEALERMSAEEAARRMNFVVNVGTRETYSERQFACLEHFFGRFAAIASLSFTIFDLDGDASYLFELIDRYGLNRDVRVGIALPILEGGNQYIPLEQYRKAGRYFLAAAVAAAQRGITLSMDCGFTACMFTDEEVGQLERLGARYSFVCGAAIDIGPGLQAWNCFPLFRTGRVDVMRARDTEELEAMLRRQNEAILGTRRGVFEACATCDRMRRGLCQGGCKSFHSTTAYA